MQTGVYAILNKVNRKIYIGSAARCLRKRWSNHKTALQRKDHSNKHLQASWNKYGPNAFEFLLIEECPPDFCTVIETWWIEYYDSTNPSKGYNRSSRGESTLGLKFTPEAKAKLSAVRMGNKNSVGRRDLVGYKHTDEARRNMSIANIGRKHTEETKAKMSATRKGRKLSDQHKANISAARRKKDTAR
jgi:group I intron endonuclease